MQVPSSKSCCTELTICDIIPMEDQISKLNQEINDLKTENALLKFTLSNIADSDKKSLSILGFQVALMAFYRFLGPAVYNLTYWNSKVEDSTCVHKQKGCPQALAPLEEFFLVLVRLRLGLLEQDIADRFGLSCATVSRSFATWINFLLLKVKEIPLWPP